MISQDLEALRRYLHDRAFRRDPLSLEEMHQVADAIAAALPTVEAMENRFIPKGWRLITNPEPPRTA